MASTISKRLSIASFKNWLETNGSKGLEVELELEVGFQGK
jgi:hypothetical protein